MSTVLAPFFGVHVPQAAAVDLTTSYSNPGGSGDRRSLIRITTGGAGFNGPWSRIVDGNSTSDFNAYWTGASVDTWVQFDFGYDQYIIDEAKWYQQSAASHGDWKWQGSHDASSWTDIGASFTLGSSATQTLTSLSANTTRYRYYRLYGVSGSRNSGPYIYEVQFKITTASWTSTTSYANPGGTGNRSALITVTSDMTYGAGTAAKFVDATGATTDLFWTNGQAVAGKYVRFDFGASASKVIDEARFVQQSALGHGVWKWQASNNGTTWTDIGGSDTLGDRNTTSVIFGLGGNTTGYRYYQILGVSGSALSTSYLYEIEFKISS